jgi:hypothetical protein
MNGSSHMIIFIPQDENKSCIDRKELEFSAYSIYIFLFFDNILKDFPFNFVYWLNKKVG